MGISAGYWVELSGVKFDEDNTSTWIQAMPLGSYEHPVHGTIDITSERVQQFATNVNNDVRTQKLDIDYDHKAKDGEAAGWVNKAEARPDGLWLLVDWTQKAANLIKQKAYRYFSPEFVDEWTHPKNGQAFKNVLFGGGITNRPFLKDIMPINMSDVFANAGNQPTNQEGKSMSPEQIKILAEKLGLAPDSTSDVVYAKLHETLDAEPEEKEKEKEKEEEVDAQLKLLAETNPTVQKLVDIANAQGKQLAEVTRQLRVKDVESSVAKLSETFVKKGFAISPVALASLTKALTESPTKEFSEAIVSTFTSLTETSVVALGEKGAGRGSKDGVSAVDRFLTEAKKLQEEHKIDFAQASLRVAAHNPTLFEEYQEESYAGRE